MSKGENIEAKKKSQVTGESPVKAALGKVASESVTKESKYVKIKFLLSPTGAFKLGYSIGDEADLLEDLAKELVESKFAEYVK